jgi:hypothetical protein
MGMPELDPETICAGYGLGEFHPAALTPFNGPLCRECNTLRVLTRPEPLRPSGAICRCRPGNANLPMCAARSKPITPGGWIGLGRVVPQ